MPKAISPTILKDPVDDHKTYTKKKISKKKSSYYHSLILLTATSKKPATTFYHCSPPQFTFCNCEHTHYSQNVHLDTFKYGQIQILNTSKAYIIVIIIINYYLFILS